MEELGLTIKIYAKLHIVPVYLFRKGWFAGFENKFTWIENFVSNDNLRWEIQIWSRLYLGTYMNFDAANTTSRVCNLCNSWGIKWFRSKKSQSFNPSDHELLWNVYSFKARSHDPIQLLVPKTGSWRLTVRFQCFVFVVKMSEGHLSYVHRI